MAAAVTGKQRARLGGSLAAASRCCWAGELPVIICLSSPGHVLHVLQVRLFNAIAKAQKQLRDAAEATGNKAKAAKLGRASFLAELKGMGGSGAAGAAAGGGQLVPSAPRAAVAAAAPAQQQPGNRRRQAAAAGGGSSSDEDGAAGWDVLQEGFVGLQGRAFLGAGLAPMSPACYALHAYEHLPLNAWWAQWALVIGSLVHCWLLPDCHAAGGSKMKDWDKQASDDEESAGEGLDDSESGGEESE